MTDHTPPTVTYSKPPELARAPEVPRAREAVEAGEVIEAAEANGRGEVAEAPGVTPTSDTSEAGPAASTGETPRSPKAVKVTSLAKAAGLAKAVRRVPRRPSWLVAGAVLSVGIPPGAEAFGPGVQVTAGDIASVLLVVVAASLLVTRRVEMPRAALAAFGPLIAALGVSTVCSTDVASSLPGFVRSLQIFVLVPLAVVLLVRDRRDLAIVCSSVLALGLGEAVYGIWQSATGNGASMGEHNMRAVGTFGAVDVMAMSIVVGIAFLVLTAFALKAPGRGIAAVPAALAGLGVLAVALALALSRGTWLALGAAAVLTLVIFNRWTAVKVLICCAALVLVTLAGMGGGSQAVVERGKSMAGSISDPDRSVEDRYNLWGAAVRIWQDHPVTGVGVKNFPAYRDTYAGIELSSGSETADPVNGYVRQPLLSPHNEYLLFLSEQGVAGLAALVALLAVIVAGLWTRRDAGDPFWLASVALTAFLLVNFLYADLGGPTCAFIAIVLGVVAARAFGDFAPAKGAPGRARA
ncbi:O-antigen ligase family protein [Actinomadura sp. 7K507]|uniref:O-antigen ligase family protein n=1 Tax=Actinomadura sp. 7K507 TaxID=2530365 RepID=UPI00104BA391|nr:O-antigen ligase family protein [Actinomadura sp. 7K507]TDC81459.1 O-antigen ligase domain-containing protein [Actinomadura sp. 7K507]